MSFSFGFNYFSISQQTRAHEQIRRFLRYDKREEKFAKNIFSRHKFLHFVPILSRGYFLRVMVSWNHCKTFFWKWAVVLCYRREHAKNKLWLLSRWSIKPDGIHEPGRFHRKIFISVTSFSTSLERFCGIILKKTVHNVHRINTIILILQNFSLFLLTEETTTN